MHAFVAEAVRALRNGQLHVSHRDAGAVVKGKDLDAVGLAVAAGRGGLADQLAVLLPIMSHDVINLGTISNILRYVYRRTHV